MAFNFFNNSENGTEEVMSEGLFLTIIRPKTVDETAVIVEKIKERKIVAFTLENIISEEGQRIIDILSGAVQITSGRIQKITDKVFVIVPNGVEIENI